MNAAKKERENCRCRQRRERAENIINQSGSRLEAELWGAERGLLLLRKDFPLFWLATR